jgi:hypothetical protein
MKYIYSEITFIKEGTLSNGMEIKYKGHDGITDRFSEHVWYNPKKNEIKVIEFIDSFGVALLLASGLVFIGNMD